MNLNKSIYGLIGLARRAGKISFGTESCIESIKKKKAKLVILAKDCSTRTMRNFEELCKNENILFYKVGTILDLSSSIGQVNKAVITINEENFSKEIKKRIDGGEFIG